MLNKTPNFKTSPITVLNTTIDSLVSTLGKVVAKSHNCYFFQRLESLWNYVSAARFTLAVRTRPSSMLDGKKSLNSSRITLFSMRYHL